MVKGPTVEASKTNASDVADIELVSVNDSDWRCTVGFLADANSLSIPYSKLLPEAISSGKRRVIYSISFLDIIKTIKQRPGCSPSNTKSAAGYGEIYTKLCSEALSYGNESKKFSIPPRLLASLLKVKILQIKAEAIRRSEMLADLAKRKEEDDQIIFARRSDISQSNKNGKPKSKVAEEQHPVGNCPPKRNTKLRKRGEEWLDIEYIEDSPEDGPDAYIIISNFYDAKLTYELLRIGVPLQCIIKLELEILSDAEMSSSSSSTSLESSVDNDTDIQHRDTTISLNPSIRDTEILLTRVSSISGLSYMKLSELILFWSELEELMYEPETRTLYKEVATWNLTIPETLHPPSNSAEELLLKQTLYDQVSWLMYDLHDVIKQHELFLKNLVLRSIPNTENESSLLTMDVYCKMLDSIPNECCDVLIIVNCLIEQVIASVEHSELSADEYLTLHEEEQVTDIPENDCIEKILQLLIDNYAMVETPTLLNPDPLVLSFADRLLKRNYHYVSKHLDIENVSYNYLKFMPLFRLWDEYKINDIKIYQEHIELVGKYISSEPIPYNLICCYIYVYLFYNMYCSNDIRVKQEPLEKSPKKIKCRSKVHKKDKYIPQTVEDWCAAIVSNIIISAKDEKKSYEKTFPAGAQSARTDSNKLTFNKENIQGNRSQNIEVRNPASKGKVQALNKSANSLKTESHKLVFGSVSNQKNQINEKNTESGIYLGNAKSWTRSKDQSKISWKSKSSVARLSSRHKSSMIRRTQSALISSRSLQKSKSVRKNLLRIPEMTEDKLKYKILSDFVKYRMIEEMNSSAFLEVIKNASEEFYDVEHFYLDATDNILLRFFNPRCKYGFTERSFENYLTTACGLKDFCDYVMGNEWTWFEEEQEEKIIATTSLTSVLNIAPEISPYPFYIDADFIIPNSIKWKILYNDTEPQPYSESTIDKDHGAIRTKTDTGFGSISSDLSSSAGLLSDENKERGNRPSPVYGYDVGFDLRAQFSEIHSVCNLEDGCNVNVKVKEQIYFTKSVCLQVKMFDSILTYNFQLWPKVHGPERGDSFFLQSGSGVRMSFKKCKDDEWVSTEFSDSLKRVRFDLQLSWENGLHVTLKKNNLKEAVDYVSQTYIVHHKVRANIENECKRCYLRNGQILKFLSNESIVLLCPDGRIFTFTLEKSPIKPVNDINPVLDKVSFNTLPDYNKKKRKSKLKAASPEMDTRTSNIPATHDHTDETPQPLFHVKGYSVLLPNGSYITNKDGFEIEEENKYLVRTCTDVGGGELFVRRSDGTNILERADGSRVVAFPDGSRITALMSVEDEEIFCEWIYSEIYKYTVTAINFRVFGDRDGQYDTILLLDEGYVSIILTHVMEHPNYATVTYKGNKLPIELSSVGDIKVTVSHDNLYDIKLNDVDVSIKGNRINMSREDSCNATIKLFTDTNSDHYSYDFCTAENKKGDCFYLKNDGSCLFLEKEDTCPLNPGHGICECETERGRCRCSIPHKPKPKTFHYKDQRCFVLNRKMSGVELIHEDEVHSHLKKVQSTRNGRVALLRPDFESDLCYIVAMVPLAVNESERWLVPSEKARITTEERELFTCLPSTYGTPPSWFHRFPITTEENINVDCYEPNVLEIRLFQEIFSSETDVISTTWSALNNYYNTSLQDIDSFEKFPFGNSRSEQSQNVEDTIREKWQRRTSPTAGRIYQLALFYTTTKEEPEAYRSWVKHKASWAVSKSCLDERLRREKSNRKAFRENVFPPYFSSPEANNYFLIDKIKKSLQTCIDNINVKQESEVPSTSHVHLEKVPDETSSDVDTSIPNSDQF